MTKADFQEIERKLNVVLLSFYKTGMTVYPFSGEDLEFALEDLWDKVEVIIKKNLAIRKSGFFGQKWNNDWFIFGEDGMGDYYYLDTAAPTGISYFLDICYKCRNYFWTS